MKEEKAGRLSDLGMSFRGEPDKYHDAIPTNRKLKEGNADMCCGLEDKPEPDFLYKGWC